MTMLSRVGVVRAKLEAEAGTAVVPDAECRVYDPTMEADDTAIDRPAEWPSAGTIASVPGAQTGTFSGRFELCGTGAAALDPCLVILLQICGSDLNAAVYAPASAIADQSTATLHFWEQGKRKGLSGAHGSCKFTADAGGIIYVEVELQGNWIAPVDEAQPAHTANATLPMMAKNCTFTTQTFAAKVSSFTWDWGVQVAARQDIAAATGVLHFCGTGRKPTFTCDPEAGLVATHDWDGIRLASTEGALSLVMTDGTLTLTLAVDQCQYRTISDGDREGLRIHNVTAQLNVTDAGDDDWTLTVS